MENMPTSTENDTTKSVVNGGEVRSVLSLLCVSVLALLGVIWAISSRMTLPADADLSVLSLTSFFSLSGAQSMINLLEQLTSLNYFAMLSMHALCFLFLQTFAIPGTIVFNLLGGALFGMRIGYPLCLVYNTIGSCFLFLISRRWGSALVQKYKPNEIAAFKARLAATTSTRELWFYMVAGRVFPFSPNWFINVASPQVGVGIPLFASSVFVGLAPYNFLTCKAGLILRSLTSKGDIISAAVTVKLVGAAVALFVVPQLVKRFICPTKEGKKTE
jgi:uncharacterized membrane protein YdjX (TVP38/TMEM64 family)